MANKPAILLLNGPNLNLLGVREPSLYGHISLDTLVNRLQTIADEHDVSLRHVQSNAEHQLINQIHQAHTDNIAFILINPAALAHTSIALRDAFLVTAIPFIEIHLSNIYARENFRHHSYLSDIAVGMISGLGIDGYGFALQAAICRLQPTH